MARTLLLSAGIAALVIGNWARLEMPKPGGGELLLMAVLGIAPALLPRLHWRLAASIPALLVAGWIALAVARPYQVGELAGRAGTGFLDFYDVLVPFDAAVHPRMHGMILLAVFAFTLLGALAVASRRPVAATLVLIAGAGWPATIYPSDSDLGRGAVLLIGALTLFAAISPRPGRAPAQVLAGTGLLALALVASSWGAVGKDQFTNWQQWDLYTKPDNRVGVEFAWRSKYDGIHFPAKKTRVLTVDAEADSTYWRATTLDSFIGGHWDEELSISDSFGPLVSFARDPLLPPAAADEDGWTRADVKVEALRDRHLVGAEQPIAYDTSSISDVEYAYNAAARARNPLPRGTRYTVWGYAPEPKPAQLARSRPDYPREIEDGPYLEVEAGWWAPTFGEADREEFLEDFFANQAGAEPYRKLYTVARNIAGDARNPYAATVALEAWFRTSAGFEYDETPPKARGVPPLVHFVTQSHRGYCQHFAGAMALMLRYLGIPARVAVGFTSGDFDLKRNEWSVYDRNAHAWVEVWFRGYGWLPFDPTPSRGNLGGPYTSSSLTFEARGARDVLAASGLAAQRLLRFELGLDGKPGRGDPGETAFTGGVSPAGSGKGQDRIGVGTIAAVVVLLLTLLLVVTKLAVRRSRYLTGDPRRVAAACRAELVGFLVDQRIEVPRAASLGELRRIVSDNTGVDPRGLVESLGIARYGPPSAAPAAARHARRELRAVQRRLRKRLPATSRARGLFSLRSLLADQ